MKVVGNSVFHNFGAQWKDTPSYCDFSGFISIVFGICRKDQQSCMGGVEVGGHNMINMTIRELYYAFADFFQKGKFFFFDNINFAKRNSEAAMERDKEYIL